LMVGSMCSRIKRG
jgi:hypothetical protein